MYAEKGRSPVVGGLPGLGVVVRTRCRPECLCRDGQGRHRRGDAGRHRRGRQSGPHREGPHRGHGRQRSVPHHRPASGNLHRHLHARRIFPGHSRRRRASRDVHGERRRRVAGRIARREHHGFRPDAARRSAECHPAGRAEQGTARSGADRPQPLGCGCHAGRRLVERTRRRRHRRHAANLHGRARVRPARQLHSGGRHDRERHRGRRCHPELLQSRHVRGDELPDERAGRGSAVVRGAPEHDSQRRQQRLQGIALLVAHAW